MDLLGQEGKRGNLWVSTLFFVFFLFLTNSERFNAFIVLKNNRFNTQCYAEALKTTTQTSELVTGNPFDWQDTVYLTGEHPLIDYGSLFIVLAVGKDAAQRGSLPPNGSPSVGRNEAS